MPFPRSPLPLTEMIAFRRMVLRANLIYTYNRNEELQLIKWHVKHKNGAISEVTFDMIDERMVECHHTKAPKKGI